ncbi:class I SAM-dependent methyltransferase [Kribbella sp.]|uniref:class I SAM-dependent methyltransferase n=1 Tax=Kribbella sp. TaxID=1871183 RepID=UPI002D3A73BA|nr:class I SAM-dependent methyltransferase [Kribbella sp.]HZX01655.1 class I SAM-dependent methyltransferase [Kribbella sp.]
MLQDITESNRASWNQIHHARPGEPVSFFTAGGSTLTAEELAAAGDVRGRRVLHLACSCGDEVLSWAQLGASVTGVDISEVALAMAIEKSAATGIPADFVRADMLALPPSLTGFDLIYLSWGAVCWLPDLDVFAESVAARLSPGGSVLIAEHHPAWETLAVRGPNQLEVIADYFGRSTPLAAVDNAKRPTGARDNPDAPAFKAFIWPPSDVITALLKAGLTLTSFQEAPDPDSYPGLDPAASALPATYLIVATRNVSHETLPESP